MGYHKKLPNMKRFITTRGKCVRSWSRWRGKLQRGIEEWTTPLQDLMHSHGKERIAVEEGNWINDLV